MPITPLTWARITNLFEEALECPPEITRRIAKALEVVRVHQVLLLRHQPSGTTLEIGGRRIGVAPRRERDAVPWRRVVRAGDLRPACEPHP